MTNREMRKIVSTILSNHEENLLFLSRLRDMIEDEKEEAKGTGKTPIVTTEDEHRVLRIGRLELQVATATRDLLDEIKKKIFREENKRNV